MRRPFPAAVLAAAGLHAGLVAAMATAPRPPLLDPPPPALFELTLEPLAPPPRPSPEQPGQAADPPLDPPSSDPPPSGPPGGQAAQRPLVASLGTAARQPSEALAPLAAASGGGPELPPAASAATVSPFASGGPSDERGRQAIAGLMRGSPWLLGPSAGAPTSNTAAPGPPGPRSEDPDRGGRLLRESLDRADQAKGLGFGGPVATAAHQASLSKSAPVQGSATFEIQTDPSGAVVSVRLSGPTGGDWSGVTAVLRSLLASKKLRVPPGARGVAVAVRVEARQQLPSGRAPGSGPASVDHVGPLPSGLGVSGKFDLADLSGAVSRVVSSRIISERRLLPRTSPPQPPLHGVERGRGIRSNTGTNPRSSRNVGRLPMLREQRRPQQRPRRAIGRAEPSAAGDEARRSPLRSC